MSSVKLTGRPSKSIRSDSYPTNTTLTRTLSSRSGRPPGFKESKPVGFAPLTLEVTMTKMATEIAMSLNFMNPYIHPYINSFLLRNIGHSDGFS